MRTTSLLILLLAVGAVAAVAIVVWESGGQLSMEAGPSDATKASQRSPNPSHEASPVPASAVDALLRSAATPETVAVSTAQEAMTFAGHLESCVRKGFPAPGEVAPLSSGFGNWPWHLGAARVAESPDYNPDKKELTSEQINALTRLLAEQELRLAPIRRKQSDCEREAMLRAVAAAQYVSHEPGPWPIGDPGAAHEYLKTEERAMQSLMDDLTARLGKPLVDWSYMMDKSTGPDGVGRATIIYFTRRDEPAAFEARRQVGEEVRRHFDEVKAFFAGLSR